MANQQKSVTDRQNGAFEGWIIVNSLQQWLEVGGLLNGAIADHEKSS
jgi:hypothetical protein